MRPVLRHGVSHLGLNLKIWIYWGLQHVSKRCPKIISLPITRFTFNMFSLLIKRCYPPGYHLQKTFHFYYLTMTLRFLASFSMWFCLPFKSCLQIAVFLQSTILRSTVFNSSFCLTFLIASCLSVLFHFASTFYYRFWNDFVNQVSALKKLFLILSLFILPPARREKSRRTDLTRFT